MLTRAIILAMLACIAFTIYSAMLPDPEAPVEYDGRPRYIEEPMAEPKHPGIFGYGERFDTPGRLQGRLQVQRILGPMEMMVQYVWADRLLIIRGVDTASIQEDQELQLPGEFKYADKINGITMAELVTE